MTLEERYTDLLQRMEEFVQASAKADQTDELAPSLLLLGIDPRAPGNNSRVRIVGNVRHIAVVLATTLADPNAGEFAESLADAMEVIDDAMDTGISLN
jgi:hypothetical protein